MNMTGIKGATSNGAARIRRLADGWTLINIPDAETTFFMTNADRLFDLSKCKRISRGAAHRIVHSITDASEELKAHYHWLIDAANESEVK